MSGSEIKMARTTVYLAPGILESSFLVMTASALPYIFRGWEYGFEGSGQLSV